MSDMNLRALEGTATGSPSSCGCCESLANENSRLKRQLREALAAAEAAAEAKSVFLANISHEIRTPLNGMIAVSQLLLCTALCPQQRELAETLQESGQALLSVLGDVLDFSCIDRNDLELRAAPLWVRDALEACLEGVAAEAGRRGLRVAYRLDPELASRRVCADPLRLRQVLALLLSNAVKFNHDYGEVVVEARLAAGGDGDASPGDPAADGQGHAPTTVLVSVVDSGIGLEGARVGRLFEGFAQGEESMSRRHGGTGARCSPNPSLRSPRAAGVAAAAGRKARR